MRWIGLTGSIGSGKSTAADFIRKSGFPVIDADRIAHTGLLVGTPSYDLIQKKYGSQILSPDGSVDRRALGKIVFEQPQEKKWLESILHPMVQAKVRDLRNELEAQGTKVAFYEVPLLFEKGLKDQFDATVVVWVSEDTQKQRLKQRNGWTDLEIQQRVQAQLPTPLKRSQADYAINNDGTLQDLESKIKELLNQII